MTDAELDTLDQVSREHGNDAPREAIDRIVGELRQMRADRETLRLQIEANFIARFEAAVYGEGGVWPGWVYEARTAIKHQNVSLSWLPDLLKAMGWQAGTIHQALNAIWRVFQGKPHPDSPEPEAVACQILESWDAWDAEAGQQAQVEQSSEVYTQVMLGHIRGALAGMVGEKQGDV